MNKVLPLFGMLISCVYLSGCAGTTYRSVSDDLAEKGIRYYDTSPYVFVHTDNEGGLTSEFVYLPDTTKKRVVKPYAWMAKNNTKLTWDPTGTALTGSSSEIDSGEVPEAIAGALQEAGKTFVKGLSYFDTGDEKPKAQPDKAPVAYLFKVVKRDGEWGLEGAVTDAPMYQTTDS